MTHNEIDGDNGRYQALPQAAKTLGIPVSTLRRAVNAGSIPVYSRFHRANGSSCPKSRQLLLLLTREGRLMDDFEALNPNHDEAVTFVANYYRDGPRHISVIHEGQSPITRTFQPAEDGHLREFVERENRKGGNIYFSVNEIAETAWNKKAQKTDVTGVTALHCDLDDPSDRAFNKFVHFNPPPSIILRSGGGNQAFWLLKSSTSEFALAEAPNKAIADQVGGDACHNIDHLMRLAVATAKQGNSPLPRHPDVLSGREGSFVRLGPGMPTSS